AIKGKRFRRKDRYGAKSIASARRDPKLAEIAL
ncbi:hypothetical protein HID58_032430, partial [Brassica napus]